MTQLLELHEHASRLAKAFGDWRKAYFAMYGYATQSEAENERLRLRHHQHTYCAYCGEEFPADVEGAADAVGAHIFACEKHPIAWIKKVLRDEVWADMTLGTIEEIRLFELLNWMDGKALGGG